ncbi:MAG: right-handed parallel beta-helix repeat-containing protein [Acidimicrobiia bacterium]
MVAVVSACSPTTATDPAVTTTAASSEVTHPGHATDPTDSSNPPATAAPAIPVSDADRVLSGDESFPDGFVVPAGQVWMFDPDVSTTVEVAANVVVEGTLVMRPSSAEVEHLLRFVDIDEDAMVGGGMEPLATDVGLWVVGDGMLDLQGTEKTPWGYQWDDAWEGDEVVAAPNQPGDYTTFAPVTGPDDVPPPNDLGYPTELLDLSRNVRIEGTETGRTHVFVHSSRPQTIRFVAIRHVAPAPDGPDTREQPSSQTGRYGLHIHMNADASRGTLVEGVVIRDAGNHAFVPHGSNGVTFKNTIAYNVYGEAYWWDPSTMLHPGNESNDILWDGTVAALVYTDGNRGAAFSLGGGENLTLVNAVAVGIQRAGRDTAGFQWPGHDEGVWNFRDNIAHNNHGNGIFVWQNTKLTHLVEDFLAYYNAKAGIHHGAYRNAYHYRNLLLLANGEGEETDIAVRSSAVGTETRDGGNAMQLWEDVETGGAVLRTTGHAQDAAAPIRFVDCDFSEVILGEGQGHFSIYEFVDCGLGPEDITVEGMHPDSVVRGQNGGEAWQMNGDGSVAAIDPFA